MTATSTPITQPIRRQIADETNDGAPDIWAWLPLSTILPTRTRFSNHYPAYGTGQIRLLARASALYTLEKEVHRYRAHVVLIDASMIDSIDALGQVIHNLRHHPEYPIITVGLCHNMEWIETFRKLGAC